MKMKEYKILSLQTGKDEEVVKALNESAKEGWNLAKVLLHRPDCYKFLLEREKASE